MDDTGPVHRAHRVENYNGKGVAGKVSKFQYNRKCLALHQERATEICDKYRDQE